MIKITNFLYINFLCIPLFFLAYFSNATTTLFLAYGVAVIHELFHLFAALVLDVGVKSVIIMPFGITLRLKDNIIKNPIKEIAVALSGPFANFLMIVIAAIFVKINFWEGAGIFLFLYINIAMFFINMLPCMPLDGGRIFKALLVKSSGYITAVSFQKKIEKVILFFLALSGAALVFVTKFNISLIMITAFLIFNMVGEDNEKNYARMQEITAYKSKLAHRKYMTSKAIAARGDVKALDVLKRVGYDSFYVIHIIDENMRIKKSITEAEIVDGIKKEGAYVTLGGIAEK